MTGEGAVNSVPSFADVLRLRSDSGAPEGVSRTTATLDRPWWWSWSSPHGGLLAALALTAARGVVADDRVAQCVNIHFLVPVGEEELALEARSLRAGGSSDVVRVDGSSGEVPVLFGHGDPGTPPSGWRVLRRGAGSSSASGGRRGKVVVTGA